MPRSASVTSDNSGDETDTGFLARARSTSPFRRRRTKKRNTSPSVEALKLSQSDVESDVEGSSSKAIRPRNNAFSAATDDDDFAEDDDYEDEEESEESWDEEDVFDPITEKNTERNAIVAISHENDALDGPDPLGEGVNIVVPPEPYFPTTLNPRGNAKRKKSTRQVALPTVTSRPTFMRDRCIITLTQGDPAKVLEDNGRRARRYVVASDLSEESRYAVEWGIGTVLRDGDEM